MDEGEDESGTSASASGSVCLDSVPELLLNLCESIVFSKEKFKDNGFLSFLEESEGQFHLPWVTQQTLCRKLRATCLDLILLRQWEWHTQEQDVIGSPYSCCLGHILSLYNLGLTEQASQLMRSLDRLLGPHTRLSRPHSVLQFLHLLSCLDQNCKPRVRKPKDWIYSTYPSEMFERLPLEICDTNLLHTATEIFEHHPGSGFKSFMSNNPPCLSVCSKDQTSRSDEGMATDSGFSEGSLFGALIRTSSVDLHATLDLPALPSDHKHLSFIPYKISPSQGMQCPSSLTYSVSSDGDLDERMKILEDAAVSCNQDQHMLRGWEGWFTDRAFTCDAMPPAPLHLMNYLNSGYAEYVGVSREEVGLPQLQSMFSEQLLQLIDQVPRPTIPLALEEDHVVFSVNRCLHRLLVACRSKLLVLADPGLSQLEKELASTFVIPVVRWVMDITQQAAHMQRYELLDYCYTQASRLQGSAHYLLFLSLLAQALRTYFHTVERWVFQGILDSVQFIGIDDNPAALDRRDEAYWTNGYVSSALVLPPFLSHLSTSILSCGKALNLLRLCQPQHHLCTGVCKGPSLRLCFSSDQLLEVSRQCTSYQEQIAVLNHTLHDQLEQKRLAEEEAEMAVLVKARQEARKKHTQIKQWEVEQLQIEAARKRALAIELKKEIESIRALRAQQHEDERRADQDRMAAADRLAGLVSEEKAMLESEARQEMEAYYKELYREAENKRVRAQWRLARLKLASSRQALWRTERLSWQQAMTTRPPKIEGNLEDQEQQISQENERTTIKTTQQLQAEDASGVQDVTSHKEDTVETSGMEDQIQSFTSTIGTTATLSTSEKGPFSEALPPSTVQHLLHGTNNDGEGPVISHPLQPTIGTTSSRENIFSSSKGAPPPSTIQYNIQYSSSDTEARDSHLLYPTCENQPSSRGTSPPSTVQDLLYPITKSQVSIRSPSPKGQPSSRGTSPSSTVQELLSPTPNDQPSSKSPSPKDQPSSRGISPPSTVQELLYHSTEDQASFSGPTPNDIPSTRGISPASTVQELLYPSVEDQTTSRGPTPNYTRGTSPASTVQELLYPSVEDQTTSRGPTPNYTRGTSPASTVQELLYPSVEDQVTGRGPTPSSTRGTSSASTVQELLYPNIEDQATGRGRTPSSTRVTSPAPTVQELLYHRVEDQATGRDQTAKDKPSTRGTSSGSTVQELLYPSVEDQATGRGPTLNSTQVQHSSRGMPPPSSIQDLLYHDTLSSSTTQGLVSRGRPPPTTIQYLLNPTLHDASSSKSSSTFPPSSTSIPIPAIPEPSDEHQSTSSYTSSLVPPFQYSHKFPSLDHVLVEMCSDVVGSSVSDDDQPIDTAFLNICPLSSLLSGSIELPLLTQCRLVQQALLEYIVSQCQLHHHFLTLKRFLLLEDGEFGNALTTQLCEELGGGHNWRVLYSPSFLRGLLTSSLEASIYGDTVQLARLFFTVRQHPKPIHPNAIGALTYLELKYEVEWPCSIVIPATIIHSYNKILHFLLEMKRSVWVLNGTFHHLKECSVLSPLQIRQLQILRHELQHFVNIMHGYIASQLFGFSWAEFQTEINENVQSLDEIIEAHRKFVKGAIFRCFLGKKAKPIMNMISQLLACILEFSSLASSISSASSSARVFQAMLDVHLKFRNNVKLLIGVLGKLIVRGYQPHLEELLLRVNFNHFY